jgi:hypothetical protein
MAPAAQFWRQRTWNDSSRMAVTPVREDTSSGTIAMLTPEKWQFKFFDVSQVKLPDDESSFLSEV